MKTRQFSKQVKALDRLQNQTAHTNSAKSTDRSLISLFGRRLAIKLDIYH